MTVVQFYHLNLTPLERAAPKLLEKAYGAGLRTHVLVASDERAEYLNQLLWTYDPDAFLPHGTAKDGNAEAQPIFLSTSLEPKNAPAALLVTEGSVPPLPSAYTRIMDMFDGANEQAVEAARARWKQYKDAGLELSYFKQNDRGGWEKAASNG